MNKTLMNPKIESISLKDLEKIQLQKINATLSLVKEKSKFYKNHLKNNLYFPIRNFKEFQKLPFTTKNDLVTLDIYDNLCVPLKEIAEVHFSSGTSGNPLPSLMSHRDLFKSKKALARTWYMQGVRKDSIFGMLASYGLFSAGLLNHYAIQEIGSFIVP